MENKTLHETLVDQAYDLFQKNKTWNTADFYAELTPIKRKAVVLGNLNYQVENGGFLQWIDSGYAEDSKATLLRIEDEINELEIKDSHYINHFTELKHGLFLARKANEFQLSEENDEESEDERNFISRKLVKLDKLDSKYYLLEKITAEMEEYLKAVS